MSKDNNAQLGSTDEQTAQPQLKQRPMQQQGGDCPQWAAREALKQLQAQQQQKQL